MILVVGATGSLGGAITQMLLAKGEQVRVLLRKNSPSEELAKQGMATSAQLLIDRGAQPITGDLKDRASLDPACRGVDTVITTANSALRGGEDNVENVDLKGNRNLIDAAKQARVKQFIFVSAHPADPNSPVPFVAAKAKTEEYLRASSIPYTIIAPDAFMEVWLAMVVGMPIMKGQPVTVVGEGRRKHSFISAGDVAAFVVAAAGNPQAINQRLVLGGPEPLSFRDAAAVYGRVLGCQTTVRSVAPGDPVPGMPESMLGMVIGMDMFDSPIEMKETARAFGVPMTPFEQVVRRMAASAPA
jgi:uncharacterized protein YbjT (DUF2867 family)